MRRSTRGLHHCLHCQKSNETCTCSQIEKLETETTVEVVLHTREARNCRATGPLAVSALRRARLHLFGVRDSPLNLSELRSEERRLIVLSTAEEAQPLEALRADPDPRPLTLVVPDGTWKQAGRIARRIPGLEGAERAHLGTERLPTHTAIESALEILGETEAAVHLRERSKELFPSAETSTRATPTPSYSHEPGGPLEILFQDESLIAINKPSGMLVHPGWGRDGPAALQVLRDQIDTHLYPVHRLDRATSGVLLFALRSEVARDLQAEFTAARVDKRYLALVRGNTLETSLCEQPLPGKSENERIPAATHFRLLARFERYGLVEAKPRTGRTHQIRRHLKHLAHPIIGDVRYGKGEHNRLFRERFDFHRLALHCAGMSFTHPRTGKALTIQAPLSDDLKVLFKELDFPETFEVGAT